MKYITTALLMFMTAALIICGILLWRRRKETGDYSRTIQAILSWVSAFFTFTFIFRTWAGTAPADATLFEPEHTFVPLLCQMTFFFYPLEVIRPTMSRAKLYGLLFAPLLLLVIIGMCGGIQYTSLYTYSDLWQHIGEFNVWFRILTLTIMLFYCFSLFLVPYNWRESSADRSFIMKYALGFCLIGILHFAIHVSHAYWLALMHQTVWITFFVYVAYYELQERLQTPQKTLETAAGTTADSASDKLWEQAMLLLDSNDKWRSPELSLTSLSEQLESNRTYVGESFKRNTGMTFVEYITHRRIDYVIETLKREPETNLHELFNYVGYRQRSTAWRNFQKITGLTPTEFVEGLK
jgi:methylphosphotriester-DNA--protein-cysteine methyltransferase